MPQDFLGWNATGPGLMNRRIGINSTEAFLGEIQGVDDILINFNWQNAF